MATDGCLYNDGRHLSFTSSDMQLVQLFKNLMGFPNRINLKASGTSTRKCPNLQLSNVNFYRWLLAVGLTPRKSLTLGPLKIPRQFMSDFIRGCFDGDGSIYSYTDPRWTHSYMFYTSFASGSKTFILWLRSKLSERLKIQGYITLANSNTYQLRYAKKESLVLISHMYYNERVPCLKRKKYKILRILRINSDRGSRIRRKK